MAIRSRTGTTKPATDTSASLRDRIALRMLDPSRFKSMCLEGEAGMRQRVWQTARAGNLDDFNVALHGWHAAYEEYLVLLRHARALFDWDGNVSTPAVREHVMRWLDANPWYDPAGRDADSRLVLSLDDDLVRENYSPEDADYWAELDRRVRLALPHRYSSH